MAWLSDNKLWEAFGTRALFWAGTGSDFGEVKTTIDRIGTGNTHDWHREWTATAERIESIGDECARRKHAVSAREAYIRAATYHRTAYYPLFGPKVERPLAESSCLEWNTMVKAAPLFDPPVEILEIPYEDTTLPALLVRAVARGEPRPLIVHTNGYDSTVCEMWLANAFAAVVRGYHCLLFDGPGQGRPLIEHGLRMRSDWERVVSPVVDVATKLPGVDPAKIALVGWSFGGFLVLRATAFEPRAAAVIADPGQWDQRDNVISALPLSDEQKAAFPNIDPKCLDPMVEWLRGPSADPMLRWKLLQRGLLVHGG
jgi:Alpha/beta hydrolase family